MQRAELLRRVVVVVVVEEDVVGMNGRYVYRYSSRNVYMHAVMLGCKLRLSLTSRPPARALGHSTLT